MVREFSTPGRWNELRLILGVRTVAKLLEEIADSLSEFSIYLANSKPSLEIDEIILNVKSAFEKVFEAYIKSDVEMSEDSIEMLEEIEEELLRMMKSSDEYKLVLQPILSACKHMKSIGEIAFNKSVRETLPRR